MVLNLRKMRKPANSGLLNKERIRVQTSPSVFLQNRNGICFKPKPEGIETHFKTTIKPKTIKRKFNEDRTWGTGTREDQGDGDEQRRDRRSRPVKVEDRDDQL